MQHSRFVFIATPAPPGESAVERIIWVLVSSNNRPLGLATSYREAYADSRESVLELKANRNRIVPVETTVELTGQWTWRVELDGVALAKSSRSYLRARESQYNLQRFLEAVPDAEVVAGVRSVRRGRSRVSVAEPC